MGLSALPPSGKVLKEERRLRTPTPRLLEYLHPLSATLRSGEGVSKAERGQGVRRERGMGRGYE